MAAAEVVSGAGGAAYRAPLPQKETDPEVIAQWVIFPTGHDQAVGLIILGVEDKHFHGVVIELDQDTARAVIARGMEHGDTVFSGISGHLRVRDRYRAVSAAENMARVAVHGRLPVFPLDAKGEQVWAAIGTLCTQAEDGVN